MQIKKEDNLIVIKRNGEKEEFQDEKIKKQLLFACNGNKELFKQAFENVSLTIRKNEIQTKEIQERLIKSLSKQITIETPEYNLVVGRLYTWNFYSQVYKKTKFKLTEYKEHIKYLVKEKFYKKDILKYLNKLNNKAINLIEEHLEYNKNQDFNRVYVQTVILNEKDYVIKDRGKPVEYPILMDIADSLILSEGNSNKFIEFFDALHYQKLSLATPFKRNLRRYKGNLGSCFIGETDDTLASLEKTYGDVSFISKFGGGVGWDLSKIRPSGSSSNRVQKSVKVNKWIKVLNDIIVATTQGGGTRKGALTCALSWWHLDVHDFISIKSELDGDIRDKAFDIFPQIVVDNYFIEKVKNNEDVCLFDHFAFKKKTKIDVTELIQEDLHSAYEQAFKMVKDKKIKGKIFKAKELWKKILWTWVEIGDFYIFNKDVANRDNYLKDFGIAKCGNLCQESFSLTKVSKNFTTEVITTDKNSERKVTETDGMYHSCNLISINLANLTESSNEEKERIAKLAVNALDKSIDLSDYPVLEAQKGSFALRNIGIGFVGMADYLAYNDKILNKEGIEFAEKTVEFFTYNCYKESIELAKEKGSYELYRKADYSKIIGKDPEELNKRSLNNFNYKEIQNNIKKFGIRNFYLMSLAPNTTTGGLVNGTASYLPVYSKEMYQTFSNFTVPVLPKYIKEKFWYYKTKWQYKPSEIIEYTRKIQNWVDTGISMEININPDLTTINEISDSIIEGFLSNELKAVYYSLTIGNDKNSTCTDCAN